VPDNREITVADRPTSPLVVYDGDCAFCRQWIDRWRGMTGPGVQYRPYQEVAGRFPEIGEASFKARFWLIEPDGRARGGAGAAFRLYALAGVRRWPDGLYRNLPGFAGLTEAGYGLVARHRDAAMFGVRWLWGSIDRRPTYRRTRSILIRGLGLTYLTAFWSMAVQVDGLMGSRGIAPAAEFIDRARQALGGTSFGQIPTLLWFDSSDQGLHGLCWGGVVLGGLVVAGVLTGPCLALLWLMYLSLVTAGQPFLGYQWDALLLEAGLLGILLTPWGLRLDRARREPSAGVIWLFRWLVFRLMVLSGVVKLTSGDPAWSAWQAMKYHYETQPLPTWTSWYMHQLPAWLQEGSVGFLFWAELVAPFLIFGPRRVRMVSFASLVLLQVLIAATGNYGFFNLLSIVLCLSLVEDRDWGRKDVDRPADTPRSPIRRALLGAAGAVIVTVTTMEGLDHSGFKIRYPAPLKMVRQAVAPFQSLNAYGLFAVMTTERPEIEVEGSEDGETWKPYTFRWKPGEIGRAPRFCPPHMPRLDWQMWFAALRGDCRSAPWFLGFERRLLEGTPEVRALLRDDPFPDKPPRYLRARLYLYRFTGRGDRAWWRREEAGWFCPPVGL
jgi:predicted DCC family thiol-disulfide oxidoreductase YuxK